MTTSHCGSPSSCAIVAEGETEYWVVTGQPGSGTICPTATHTGTTNATMAMTVRPMPVSLQTRPGVPRYLYPLPRRAEREKSVDMALSRNRGCPVSNCACTVHERTRPERDTQSQSTRRAPTSSQRCAKGLDLILQISGVVYGFGDNL